MSTCPIIASPGHISQLRYITISQLESVDLNTMQIGKLFIINQWKEIAQAQRNKDVSHYQEGGALNKPRKPT